jgi:hypothetical protein
MQAQSRTGSDTRLRALALLLTCVLGLALVTAAHSISSHNHTARGVAVLTVNTVDLPQHASRPDQDGSLARAPTAVATAVGPSSTSTSSTDIRSRTAQAPQVRGPPAEALA